MQEIAVSRTFIFHALAAGFPRNTLGIGNVSRGDGFAVEQLLLSLIYHQCGYCPPRQYYRRYRL